MDQIRKKPYAAMLALSSCCAHQVRVVLLHSGGFVYLAETCAPVRLATVANAGKVIILLHAIHVLYLQ